MVRQSQRQRTATAKASQVIAHAQCKSHTTAIAGLLALRGGRGGRGGQSQSSRRRRGSSTTASLSHGEETGGGPGAGAGGAEEEDEDEDVDSLDPRESQEESNTRYRRQRGLQREESNVPDSQPPTSAQPAEDDHGFNCDPPLDFVLKHFDFQAVSTIKSKTVGGAR